MIAEFQLSKDDLHAFNFYHNRYSPTVHRQYLRIWLLYPAVWLLACIGIWYLADQERNAPLQTFLNLSPLFIGPPLYLAIFPWGYRRRLRKIVEGMVSEGRNREMFSPRRVTIAPEGVTDATQHGQSTTAWPAVERVVATDQYAYIYVNALAAIIVPRRAFVGQSEFADFVRSAQMYQKEANA